jgi:hypothetical protein
MGKRTNPTVTIIKWADFNYRKDVKRPSWFRFDHKMIEDSQFYSFTDAEFKAWIYLLSVASQRSSGTITVNLEHAERVCCIKSSDLFSAIQKLEEFSIVHVDVTDAVRARNVDVPDACSTRQDIQTDTTRGANAPATLSPEEFILLWNENRGPLPEANKLSTKRRTAIRARLRENAERDYWAGLVRWLAASPWHTGRHPDNKRGWKASLDFLLQAGKHEELSEKIANESQQKKPVLKTLADLEAEDAAKAG